MVRPSVERRFGIVHLSVARLQVQQQCHSLIEIVTCLSLPFLYLQRMALVESRHNRSHEDTEPFASSRSENEDSEDGFNPAMTKILGIPRSPIVSEPFMIPAQAQTQSGGSSDASSSSPDEREPISTRAISPPSSTSLTVTSASRSNRKGDKSSSPTSVTVVNGMIHDPNYQELCQQLMHLGVGPSSPVEQGFSSPTLTRMHSPPAVHNGEGCWVSRTHCPLSSVS